MYIRWTPGEEKPIGVASTIKGEGLDWIEAFHPGAPKSQSQELVWEEILNSNGDRTAVGKWVGSEDPRDYYVDPKEIRATWLELSEGPVQASDGNWYQFDDTSERLMKGTLRALFLTGETVDWRLVDNSEVTLNYDDLRDIFEDLQDQQALRGVALNAEYLQFRAEGATFKQLANWRASYSAGS